MESEKKRPREEPTENPDPKICSFYLSRKRRFCKTECKPGSKYCHTHCATSSTPDAADTALDRRVPCPINGNHTVYASRLQQHIKVCPDLRHLTNDLPYFSENLHANKGTVYESPNSEEGRLSDEEQQTLIQRIRESFTQGIQSEMCQLPDEYTRDLQLHDISSKKHSPQHHALLKCVDYIHVLASSTEEWKCHGFVELGAGKGGLTLALQDVLLHRSTSEETFPFVKRVEEDCKLFVVDMGGFRRKADARVSHSALPMSRWRINLKDLCMTRALAEEQDVAAPLRLTILGKHLCGACSDFAASCCTEGPLLEGPTAVKAVVIATCCHHRCELKHLNAFSVEGENSALTLPGTNFKITQREFAAMVRMTSWAVSGKVVDEEKRTTGLCCKRVIDMWRVLFLREKGFQAKLCVYTTRDVTEENVCILAWR
ncbi:tRNA guanosine-2'-O-methyltransferase TRM13 [Angomonas deanei]|uniref:tRNA:m(4)X modification enzyme TRM13 n=1 Tax=Angomonas deanei TaxID=59799 RepID=A0A7G2C5I3_9TRYP|nr:tRNA guanosine-2'-O-methyltransferase TRM13 [Angomonas deanei]CAD2214013.1 CCCH zinc finger in TRM13 protein/U11-48K-like CHHC zinc finger/Methyltransferase TRM13, putative [Angomonas deanei]|eukprot:EPY43881.1 tRNA guanosine-2'-O-methyltransferase TRM13 [Angomonas deanei]